MLVLDEAAVMESTGIRFRTRMIAVRVAGSVRRVQNHRLALLDPTLRAETIGDDGTAAVGVGVLAVAVGVIGPGGAENRQVTRRLREVGGGDQACGNECATSASGIGDQTTWHGNLL